MSGQSGQLMLTLKTKMARWCQGMECELCRPHLLGTAYLSIWLGPLASVYLSLPSADHLSTVLPPCLQLWSAALVAHTAGVGAGICQAHHGHHGSPNRPGRVGNPLPYTRKLRLTKVKSAAHRPPAPGLSQQEGILAPHQSPASQWA